PATEPSPKRGPGGGAPATAINANPPLIATIGPRAVTGISGNAKSSYTWAANGARAVPAGVPLEIHSQFAGPPDAALCGPRNARRDPAPVTPFHVGTAMSPPPARTVSCTVPGSVPSLIQSWRRVWLSGAMK